MNTEKPWNVPKRTFQYIAMILCCMNIINSGLNFAWSSPSLLVFLDKDSYIPMTSSQGSWIIITIFFGVVCGSTIVAFLIDRLGRKCLIIISAIGFSMSWLMIAYAQSISALIVARFVAGIADGMVFCSVPMYLAEISEPEIRGLLGSTAMISISLGHTLMNTTGSYLSIKTAALINLSFPLISLLTFPWIPESPYYLIMQGKLQAAKRSLKIFRNSNRVECELNRINKAVELQIENTGKYLDLFTVESNRKAVYVMIIVRTVSQLSGMAAFIFYTKMIFEEAGTKISPTIATIIYCCIQMVFSVLSSLMVDRLGRRPLLITSTIGVVLMLLTEGSVFYIKTLSNTDNLILNILSIVALIGFIIFFNVGLQTIPVLLISELFSTNIKAFAFGLNDIYFCILAAAVSKVFQYTKDEFGIYTPFFGFATCCIFGLFFIVIYVPETKGKTLEEIQDLLKKRNDLNTTYMHELD